MCVGALVHARIATLVYGAAEPRTGAVMSAVRGGDLPGLNHRFEVVGGVREEECRALMQEFFQATGAVRPVRGCELSRIINGPLHSRFPQRRGTEVVVTGAPRKRLVG